MSDAEGPAPAPAADEEAPGLAEAAGARLEALAAAAQRHPRTCQRPVAVKIFERFWVGKQ